jgi:ABC-type dipeptide/oligopeptide/nickel transport system permease subunit
MNRLILKHGISVTIVVMAIFAWVIYARIAAGGA